MSNAHISNSDPGTDLSFAFHTVVTLLKANKKDAIWWKFPVIFQAFLRQLLFAKKFTTLWNILSLFKTALSLQRNFF